MNKLTLSDVLIAASNSAANFARVLEEPSFDVGLYKPEGNDPQTPHTRDELYVIAGGSGNFVCAEKIENFVVGDVFFVPAGMPHKFTNFSSDFSAWVIFFGPRPSK